MTITEELIQHVAGEPHERQQKFARARAIYEAEMDPPLVNDNGEPNLLDNVIIPAGRNIVDAGVTFLFGEGVSFDVTEAYGAEAQERLKALWRTNRMPTKCIELALHGAQTGQFVFKFEPDASDERNGAHRFVVVDPCYLDAVWDPHDTETVLLYRLEYPTVDVGADGVLAPFVWRQDIEANRSEPDRFGRRTITSWTITNSRAKAPQQVGAVRRWFATRSLQSKFEVVSTHPWPHIWAPMFAGQNQVSPNSWWGYSDIEAAVVNLNHALNRVGSNTAKTIRHHGHPTTIVRGGTLPEDSAIGEPIEFDEGPDEIDVANLEMQSDLKAALDFFALLRGEVYDAGNTPDVARGKVDNVGNLSGAAMRIMYGPLLGVTGKKRLTYGDEITAALRAALAYMKFEPLDGADGAVELVWGDPLPKNEKEDAEVAEIDQRNGASQRTTLERRGYDPDVEFDNRTAEESVDPGMKGMQDLIDGGSNGEAVTAAVPTDDAVKRPTVTDAPGENGE